MNAMYRVGPLVVGATLLVLAVITFFVGVDRALLHEGGAFEVASAALWLFTAAYAVLGQVPDRRLAGWLAGLFIVFFLRELDFHDWWFDPGLLHVKVLTGAAPLWQKAVSLGAMVGILAVVFAVGWLGVGRFVRALRARDTAAWLVLVAMGCAAISSQLDGLGRTLEPYGIQIDAAVQDAAIFLEETLEIAFPMLIILALSLALKRKRVG